MIKNAWLENDKFNKLFKTLIKDYKEDIVVMMELDYHMRLLSYKFALVCDEISEKLGITKKEFGNYLHCYSWGTIEKWDRNSPYDSFLEQLEFYVRVETVTANHFSNSMIKYRGGFPRYDLLGVK